VSAPAAPFALSFNDTTSAPTLTPVSTESPTTPETTAPVTSQATEAPSAPPMALSDDAIPGRPYVLLATSKTMTIGWRESSSTSEQIVEYIVLMDGKNVGATEGPPFEVTELQPDTSYTFTIRAVDADGSKSKPSPQLIAGTAVLLDDFADGDDMAVDDWGAWRFSSGGVQQDGSAEMHFDVAGYNDTGVQLIYAVDSGATGYSNLFLDFTANNGSETIDLTAESVVGLQFRMTGQEGTAFRVHLGTPLVSEFYPLFYQSKELRPTEDQWQLVTLMFLQNFTAPADAQMDYTLTDALKQTTALVFENDTPGQWGWFILDEVEFLTPQSLSLGEPPDEENESTGSSGNGSSEGGSESGNSNSTGGSGSVDEAEQEAASAAAGVMAFLEWTTCAAVFSTTMSFYV
jgi:hypothetical protein